MKTAVIVATASATAAALCAGVEGFVIAPSLALKRASTQQAHASLSISTNPRARAASSALMMAAAAEFDDKENFESAKNRMEKSVESMQGNLDTLRTGRANPKILNRVTVECYGVDSPLNQVASIKTISATTLLVEAYDPSILSDIADAIMKADVGLTPNSDGSVIRLNMPPVTEDRRKELAKEAKAVGEEGKIAVRNIRREAVDVVKKAEKAKSLGKDQSKDAQDAIQKLTDTHGKSIDTKVAAKEKDILNV